MAVVFHGGGRVPDLNSVLLTPVHVGRAFQSTFEMSFHSQGVQPSYMRLRLSTLIAARSSACTCASTLSTEVPLASAGAVVEIRSSASRPASLSAKRVSAATAAARRAGVSLEGAGC